MMIALVLAFLGFVGTTAGTILHLNIRVVLKDVDRRIEIARAESANAHKDVQISIANLQTKIAENEAAQYRQIMQETKATFADARIADTKHQANTTRLDVLASGQDHLATDIRSLREAMEKRLLSIEERLPA